MRLLFVLVVASLAGCVFEDCPTTDSASFEAPGLFAALAERAHTDRAPDAGIPFVDVNVTSVTWRNATMTARLSGGFVEIIAPDDDAAASRARSFLATLFDAPVEAWVDALLANRTSLAGHGQSGEPAPAPPGEFRETDLLYRAEIPGPWRAEGALEAVGGLRNATWVAPGLARAERDGWTLVVSSTVREARVDAVTFLVDARGHASAWVARDPPDAQKSASSARIDLALGALGLPEAGIPPEALSTLVC